MISPQLNKIRLIDDAAVLSFCGSYKQLNVFFFEHLLSVIPLGFCTEQSDFVCIHCHKRKRGSDFESAKVLAAISQKPKKVIIVLLKTFHILHQNGLHTAQMQPKKSNNKRKKNFTQHYPFVLQDLSTFYLNLFLKVLPNFVFVPLW